MATIVFGRREEIDRRVSLTKVRKSSRTLLRESNCVINSSLDEETPIVRQTHRGVFLVFGTPYFMDRALTELSDDKIHRVINEDYTKLDSSFLIFWIQEEGRKFSIISDRYGSIGVFWFHSEKLVFFSTEFRHALLAFKNRVPVNIDKSAILEFLWFRRLFGTKTYVEGISWLSAGSKIDWELGSIPIETQYWHPSSSRESHSKLDWADLLANSASKSVEMALQIKGSHGLMLSGGLDSRGLLGFGRDRYVTFTNAPRENTETRVAARLASLAQAKNEFISRPDHYLDIVFNQAMELSNGMTQFYECQFVGYANRICDTVDNIHIGLFWDVFFCGHYMPKHLRKVLGKPLLHFTTDQIDDTEFIEQFMNSVSYRLKSTNLSSVVRQSEYRENLHLMKERLSNIVSAGQEAGFEGVRLWEYMHLTNVGRHYSMLMARSLRPFLTVCVPALTNLNYELAFNLPPMYKTNWSVYQAMLKQTAPDLMEIINSNTHISAKRDLRTQSVIKCMRGLSNLAIRGQFNVSPDSSDRSWLPVRETLIRSELAKEKIKRMIKAGRIMEIGLLDTDSVRHAYQATMSGSSDHSVFISQLLTLEHGFLDHL